MTEAWTELSLYEPRWHGWARWALYFYESRSEHTATRKTVASGWIRRRRGAEYWQYRCERTWPKEAA